MQSDTTSSREAPTAQAAPDLEAVINATNRINKPDDVITQLRAAGDIRQATTINPRTVEGKIALFELESAEQDSLNDLAPIQIEMSNLTIREAEMTNRQSGEIEGKHRTIISSTDGNVFATMSKVVAKVALSMLESRVLLIPGVMPLKVNIGRDASSKCLTMSVPSEELARVRVIVKGGTP